MANCQKCGAECAPADRVCTQCGQKLTQEGAKLTQTVLGMVSPFAPQATEPASPNSSPAANAPSPTAPLSNTAQLGSTAPLGGKAMLSNTAQLGSTGPLGGKAMLSGTMIGMPSPVFKVAASPELQPPQATLTEAAGQPPQGASPQGKFKGTLLGIAQPGIAPRDPRDQPAPAPPRATPIVGTPVAPWHEAHEAPKPLSEKSGSDVSFPDVANPSSSPHSAVPPSSMPAPPARPFWQNALLVGLGLLTAAGIGGVAAAFSDKPVKLAVTQYTFNEEGTDQLKLMCPKCADGTILSLEGSQAIVKNEVAVLLTKKAIQVGHNELKFEVKDPSGESLDAKPVLLPIAYRQKARWTGMHELSPYAEVVIEAPPGSEVTIDGKSTPLRGTTATARIDLSSRTLGEATTSETLVLAVPMNVTVDGKKREAQATLRNKVTPLQLTSIGSLHELGGKPLTIRGRTAMNATVHVGNVKLQADAQGSFHHVIKKPVPGKLVVSSFTDQMVARRVEILLVARAVVPESSVSTFSALGEGVFARLEATVLESRVSEGVTMMLLEVQKGCAKSPCLVRGVFAEPRVLRPNQTVRISGRVQAGDPMTVRMAKFF